ncbi:signaling protein [Pseudoalteromonas sp. A601]|nr:signaling protein [Pseudoalteromonas sp. A601]
MLCAVGLISSAHAADIFVAPSGADSNNGLQGQPVASLARAKKLARSFAGKEAVTVHIADGVYYLPETLVFERMDSGSEQYPVIYKAEHEGLAVLSGGTKLQLTWSAYKNGIFQANTPAGLHIDQLFIDGKNQRMARYPNYDASKKTAAYQGYAADAFSEKRAKAWADPSGGYIHAMHRSRWGGYHYKITGKNNNKVTYEGGWQNNRQMGMHEDFRMVENIFEELDVPGEWFHDTQKNTLYFKPAKEIDLQAAKVEVVRLNHLVEFNGTELNPVQHITLQGFVVRHAARTFMQTKEPLLRSDWTIYRGGAFVLTGSENIHILDTEFDQVGGNAIFVNNYNRDVLIKGCHIHDTGASGIAFVGDPNAVRNPLFEYGEKNDLSKINKTPGPKSNNYPANSTVEDCLIHKIGTVERQPAGIQISMAKGITVRDVSIYDTARAGINIGDGTWGGHLIERVDVFDTVLETHDHGSFNSWGRDRYWRSDQTTSQAAVDKDPNLPFLDAVNTSTIRNSRWRSEHGWDIDLDDGSSNYDIYNNVMLAGGLKLREGFRRHAWNNITVHSGLHPHVWYNKSGDKVYQNIFMSQHKPARMTRPFVDQVIVDKNFYGESEEKVMSVSNNLAWDNNSIFGDPMFIDAKNGDFRVKSNSPALKIGFENFPMDQFGVKKASLRAIARIPSFSAPVKTKRKAPPAFTGEWMGASLVNLSGNDFSAFGVSKQAGGVVIKTVPKDSEAAKAGLLAGDVIQNVNGQSVSKLRQLNQVVKRTPADLLNLKLVRNQQVIELMLQMDKNLQLKRVSSPKKKQLQ